MIFNDPQNITIEELMQLAKEAGFTASAPLNMDALIFRQEVRDMCSADQCRSYGRSWSCPPAVGSLEHSAEIAGRYHRGIIVQTTGQMRREIDYHSIFKYNDQHVRNFASYARQVRTFFPGCLPMGAGACSICRKCTYPDRLCRHPDKLIISMEAYGLVVNDVCKASGLEYNYGDRTMTFTSCILLD